METRLPRSGAVPNCRYGYVTVTSDLSAFNHSSYWVADRGQGQSLDLVQASKNRYVSPITAQRCAVVSCVMVVSCLELGHGYISALMWIKNSVRVTSYLRIQCISFTPGLFPILGNLCQI